MNANLIFDPDSHFSNKFEAVIEDMLAGRHLVNHLYLTQILSTNQLIMKRMPQMIIN